MIKTELNTIYKETIFSKFYAGILIVIPTIFIILGIYFSFLEFSTTNVIFSVSFFILAIFFAVITLSSSRLSINLTHKNITIGYLFGKTKIRLKNVENCYEDEASHLRYGSWGIRLGRYNGKWRLVYSTPRTPRLVISKSSGVFKEVVFSTKKPKKLQAIIKNRIENNQ